MYFGDIGKREVFSRKRKRREGEGRWKEKIDEIERVCDLCVCSFVVE